MIARKAGPGEWHPGAAVQWSHSGDRRRAESRPGKPSSVMGRPWFLGGIRARGCPKRSNRWGGAPLCGTRVPWDWAGAANSGAGGAGWPHSSQLNRTLESAPVRFRSPGQAAFDHPASADASPCRGRNGRHSSRGRRPPPVGGVRGSQEMWNARRLPPRPRGCHWAEPRTRRT